MTIRSQVTEFAKLVARKAYHEAVVRIVFRGVSPEAREFYRNCVSCGAVPIGHIEGRTEFYWLDIGVCLPDEDLASHIQEHTPDGHTPALITLEDFNPALITF